METTPGARLASLLSQTFDGMVAEVVAELARRGHPGVTATVEFALVAIADGASDASALGRALGVSKQAAARTIATLEHLGYVSRESDAADGRRKRLEVTARGEEMVAIGAAAFEDLRRRWVATVGADEAERAEAALRALVPAPRADGETEVRSG